MKRQRRKNRSEQDILLKLSEREHKLIINEVFPNAPISQNLLNKMRLGIVSEEGRLFRITLDELAELASNVLFATNRAGDKLFRPELERICVRIEELLDIPADETLEDPLPEMSYSEEVSDWHKFVQNALHDKEFKKLENIGEILSKKADEYNRRPIREMGGLSPLQVSRLVYGDWADKNNAITFNRDLSLTDLEEARILQNARTFLKIALESNGLQTTARGNLTRKAVSEMLDFMRWPPGYVSDLRRLNEVLNETDVTPLHALRITLELAGLLRSTKGSFKITSSGKKLLRDNKAGELYGELFVVTGHFKPRQ